MEPALRLGGASKRSPVFAERIDEGRRKGLHSLFGSCGKAGVDYAYAHGAVALADSLDASAISGGLEEPDYWACLLVFAKSESVHNVSVEEMALEADLAVDAILRSEQRVLYAAKFRLPYPTPSSLMQMLGGGKGATQLHATLEAILWHDTARSCTALQLASWTFAVDDARCAAPDGLWDEQLDALADTLAADAARAIAAATWTMEERVDLSRQENCRAALDAIRNGRGKIERNLQRLTAPPDKP